MCKIGRDEQQQGCERESERQINAASYPTCQDFGALNALRDLTGRDGRQPLRESAIGAGYAFGMATIEHVLKRRGDLTRIEAYKNGAAALKFQDGPLRPHLRRPLLYSAILAEFAPSEERHQCVIPRH